MHGRKVQPVESSSSFYHESVPDWYYDQVFLQECNTNLAHETDERRKKLLCREQQRLDRQLKHTRNQCIANTYGGSGIERFATQRGNGSAGNGLHKHDKPKAFDTVDHDRKVKSKPVRLPPIYPNRRVAWQPQQVTITWDEALPREACKVDLGASSQQEQNRRNKPKQHIWPKVKTKVVGEMCRGKHYYDGNKLRRRTVAVRDSDNI